MTQDIAAEIGAERERIRELWRDTFPVEDVFDGIDSMLGCEDGDPRTALVTIAALCWEGIAALDRERPAGEENGHA